MKIGTECEGRFKGLYTLFMDGEEAMEFFDHPSLRKRAEPEIPDGMLEMVRHIYISDPYAIVLPSALCLAKWALMGMVVTLEVSRVTKREEYPANVHFMLALGKPHQGRVTESFLELRHTDQIKFHNGNYVWCVTKENMSQTEPKDFEGDFEFEALDTEVR